MSIFHSICDLRFSILVYRGLSLIKIIESAKQSAKEGEN